jgi:hypothetical protein
MLALGRVETSFRFGWSSESYLHNAFRIGLAKLAKNGRPLVTKHYVMRVEKLYDLICPFNNISILGGHRNLRRKEPFLGSLGVDYHRTDHRVF